MQITLYQRTFPAKDAPVSFSFAPFAGHNHTLTAGGVVYEAVFSEITVEVPDDAKYDPSRQTLAWKSGAKSMYSRAREVIDLARANTPGFSMVTG